MQDERVSVDPVLLEPTCHSSMGFRWDRDREAHGTGDRAGTRRKIERVFQLVDDRGPPRDVHPAIKQKRKPAPPCPCHAAHATAPQCSRRGRVPRNTDGGVGSEPANRTDQISAGNEDAIDRFDHLRQRRKFGSHQDADDGIRVGDPQPIDRRQSQGQIAESIVAYNEQSADVTINWATRQGLRRSRSNLNQFRVDLHVVSLLDGRMRT